MSRLSITITVAGASLDASVLRDVTQVTYNDSTTEIDSFEMTVNNWDPETRAFKYVGGEKNVQGDTSNQQLFNPGAHEFELKLGYGSELATIVRGTTTSLEPSFPSGGAPTLTVRALNVLHKLRTKRYSTHWPNDRMSNATISKIAEDIGTLTDQGKRRFPLPIRTDSQAKQDEPALEYLAQDNQYDIDFLLLQARQIGYVVYVDLEPQGQGAPREVLRFCPSDGQRSRGAQTRYQLEWGQSLIDFSPRLSTANQVAAVEVKCRDPQKNEPILGRSTLDDKELHINRDLFPLLSAPGLPRREEIVVKEPQYTPELAQRRARALLSDRIKELVEATGTTIGLPDLRAGQTVQIVGLGKRFSGTYFLTKTTHTINDSGYTTKFTARREESDQGGGS